MIGVMDGRGTGAARFTVGIEFVTTTFTGVGVGSIADCEKAETDINGANNPTQKSFVFIVHWRFTELKGAAVQAPIGPRS